ncbi:hypothetical protein SEPCBS119000_001185 [Sporothrix epigloea]|uniref:Uncharacterized protein n=1 Tax=Sporothrix epigloea TaxID=1892477 RepID=A0ABP0DBR6_9PEZI
MDKHTTTTKADFPAAYTANGFFPHQESKARRTSAAVVKSALTLIFTSLVLALIYQVIHDKQAYNKLLSEYNVMVSDNQGQPAPAMALMHRAVDAAAPSMIYTTTTVTQGTTITIQTVAPSSSSVSSIAGSSSSSMSSLSSELCAAGSQETITVTVSADASSFSDVFVSASSASTSSASSATSSDAVVTVMETRVTTATIFVTASGPASHKAETVTVTATATATQFATGVAGSSNHTLSGTSTSSAEAVKGSSMTSGLQSQHSHYPNSTTILAGYGTTGLGEAPTSTASYILTVPPGVGTSGTSRLISPLGTSTSQSEPVSTVVTVSGSAKTATTSLGLLFAVAIAAFHL